jgi:scyllo-inositol 2-dehydrogenase (NADP+)
VTHSQPIRVAIVGLGAASKLHLSEYWRAPFEIHCVWDANPAVLRAATAHPIAKSFDHIIARDSEVDLVIIATPPNQHFPLARACLNAGKSVIVEKPTALTFSQVSRLVKLANQRERLLLTHFNRRWDSDFQLVSDIVGNRVLGAVHHFESRVSDGYNGSRSYPNRRRWKTHSDSGGILLDWAPHLFDQLFTIFSGKIPKQIYCCASRPNRIVRQDLDEQFVIHASFENADAFLSATWNATLPLPRWYVVGASGSLRIESTGEKTEGRTRFWMNGECREELVTVEGQSSTRLAPRSFPDLALRCLTNRKRRLRESQQQLMVAYAVELARKSATRRRPLIWQFST